MANFVEPFTGGGGMTLPLLSALRPAGQVVLNDADSRVAAWWSVVANGTDDDFNELLSHLRGFVPSVREFLRLRRTSYKSGRAVERAFAVMAINRCSYSGILDAGPMGGRDQNGPHGVGSRYNAQRIVQEHQETRALLKEFDVTVLSEDFRTVLAKCPEPFAYCVPPYVRQGSRLYPTAFDQRDHEELAEILHDRDRWVASYDDNPWVRERYRGHRIIELDVTYSANSVAKGPRKRSRELLVMT